MSDDDSSGCFKIGCGCFGLIILLIIGFFFLNTLGIPIMGVISVVVIGFLAIVIYDEFF